VFLTYDMTREETFNNLNEWYKEIKAHAAPEVQIYLVGNKSDFVN
jgi:Ras-related protein Rab-12